MSTLIKSNRTNWFRKIFKNKFYLIGISITVLVVLLGGAFFLDRVLRRDQKTSFAAYPDVTTTYPTPVVPGVTQPIRVLFSYGDPNVDIDIQNAISTLNLTGTGMSIDISQIEDWYPGSPLRPDNVNPPSPVTCDFNYNGPKYQVLSNLATNTTLTYGLQSARDPLNPSGSANVPYLRAKHTGCLLVTLNIASTAPAGTVTLTFDEDSQNSPSYPSAQKPGKQIVIFNITPQNVSSSSVSSSLISSSVSSSVVSSLSSSSISSSVVSSSSSIQSSSLVSSSISSISSSVSSMMSSSLVSSSAQSSSLISSSVSSSAVSSLSSSSISSSVVSSSSSIQSSSISSSLVSSSISSISSSISSMMSSSSTSITVTGTITGPTGGNPGGSITVIGVTVPNGPATYTNGSGCVINGTFNNNVFTPNSGQIISTNCPIGPNSNGTITTNTGQIFNNINSNFTSSFPSSVTGPLVRTGGLETAVIIGLVAIALIGYLAYRSRSKRLSKIDIGGSSEKKTKKTVSIDEPEKAETKVEETTPKNSEKKVETKEKTEKSSKPKKKSVSKTEK